jgi:hypothetical protein
MTPFTENENGLYAEQAADAKLDYGLDWSDWLAKAPGDTLSTSAWAAETPGLTLSAESKSDTATSVWVEGGVGGEYYVLRNTVQSTAGRRDSRTCLVYILPASVSDKRSVFRNRIIAVAKLRRDQLVMLAAGLLPSITLTDDYLWDKLRAAESDVANSLRVKLVPTKFFPTEPTSEQLAALPADMPWEVEGGYDYEPGNFDGDKWGYIVARQRPIIAIESMRWVYPSQNQAHFDIPAVWLRVDKKYGHVRIVPSTNAMMTSMTAFGMTQMAGSMVVPEMVQLTYTAGLADAAGDYPELLDVIKKKAALKLLNDAFLPQSGSISADGLSQSLSADMSKYAETIDEALNGPSGSNGGLMTRIHGIRAMVF